MTDNLHTEIELKLLLADDLAHATLRTWLDAHGTLHEAVQSNRYLDTTDRALAARRMMMRVRLAGTQATCTAKAGAQMVDGIMRVSEWEAVLAGREAAAWRAGRSACKLRDLPLCEALVAGPLADLDDADARTFHVIGVMQTTRRAYRIAATALGLAPGPALTLELDHSLFPAGQERFELEVEHPDAAALKDAVTALLDRLGVAWRVADVSKYQQFLQALAAAPGMDAHDSDAQGSDTQGSADGRFGDLS